MAGKSDAWEAALLKLLFNNVSTGSQTPALAIGDAAGLIKSTADGSLYVALHTADPGEGGSQNTTEANYGGYARVGVVRTTSGWTVSGTSPAQVVPVAAITFPTSTGAGSTITHASIGTIVSGAGHILYSGALNVSIPVGAAGVTPSLTTASTITED